MCNSDARERLLGMRYSLFLLLILVGACDLTGEELNVRARVTDRPRYTAPDGSTSSLNHMGADVVERPLTISVAPGTFVASYSDNSCIGPHSVEHTVRGGTIRVTLFRDMDTVCPAVYQPLKRNVGVEGLRGGTYIVWIMGEEGRSPPHVQLIDTVRIPKPPRRP